MLTTGEAIDLYQVLGPTTECRCNNCAVGFLLRDLWCAQPNDLAECPEWHSTDVEIKS